MFRAAAARAAARATRVVMAEGGAPTGRPRPVALFYPATGLGYDASHVLTSRDAPHYDVPARVQRVLDMARSRPALFECVPVAASVGPGGDVEASDEVRAVRGVHSHALVDFILRVPKHPPVVPETFLIPGAFSHTGRVPTFPNLPQYAGAFCFDSWTPLTPHTVPAALESVACALRAVDAVTTDGVDGPARVAYALCRTPGHHAGYGAYGGYCYFNNAVVAARALQQRGAGNVVVVDVDFHYGNGTHLLAQQHDDLHLVSIHADPAVGYEPYFSGMALLELDGSADDGAGIPKSLNVTYDPVGISAAQFGGLLDQACAFVERVYSARCDVPGALVVSLGVDALQDDPLHTSGTGWPTEWFGVAARRLREVNGARPLVVVHEGGYSPDKSPAAVLAFFQALVE